MIYVRKSDTRKPYTSPFQRGLEPRGIGHRTDIDLLHDALKRRVSRRELWDEHFSLMLRYYRPILSARLDYIPLREYCKRDIHVLYGDTGTGKTRYCFEESPGAFWLERANNGNVWWCGYDEHDEVIIDDFYGWIPYGTFLRLLDGYPMTGETKGGRVKLMNKKVYITSNVHPSKWYKNHSYGAIRRRITKLTHLTEKAGIVTDTRSRGNTIARDLETSPAGLFLEHEFVTKVDTREAASDQGQDFASSS